ncbi:LysE/ArgO family amino acid transporter [Zavarzinia compransoris]|uniref:Amino acid transporter n=1 Tax=Zavarzinia compransoris TaxID=1264899 RepID=A0A317E8V9_9PROT|nr:LysE/ArgO family amino acid transporter [Zavarzinia compransoris]PWR21743.1 amino acid transporter [Zavarzinia compransoris]TDP45467.1 L-lysine exporter family protein LysE/ArgO [Zavarzinia compransoris]
MSLSLPVLLTGFGSGLGLIMAIGAQNAFVLRQGLIRRHVFAVCLVCALSDALLITLGITALGTVKAALPWAEPVLRYGGAAFLLWYGGRSLLSALRGGQALRAAAGPGAGLGPTLATALLLTFANPHVYLDTVVLLGTIAAQFPGQGLAFGLGAVTASFVFFFALGFGARLLAPLFARPAAWRGLDLLVAAIMGLVATKLLLGA